MNLQEFLTSRNIEYKTPGSHHHARSGWIQIDCPFCGSGSEKFHLGFNLTKNYFNCWHCGPKTLIDVIGELLEIDFRAAKALASQIDKEDDEDDEGKELERNRRLIIPKGLQQLAKPHRRYLRERGLDPDEIERLWGVKGISIHPRMPWRIWIPIYYRGRVVSWTSRSLKSNASQRYLSAKESEELINHKHLLYGEDYCISSCIAHEGPGDVWTTGVGSVCTFGTAIKEEQIVKLAKYFRRIICFDSSNMAQERAEWLCDQLSIFPGTTINVELDSEDPGSAAKKETKKLRRLAGLL